MRTILTGFRDGLDQPYEFNYGCTFDSLFQQWLYDKASIYGQRIGRIASIWHNDID